MLFWSVLKGVGSTRKNLQNTHTVCFSHDLSYLGAKVNLGTNVSHLNHVRGYGLNTQEFTLGKSVSFFSEYNFIEKFNLMHIFLKIFFFWT